MDNFFNFINVKKILCHEGITFFLKKDYLLFTSEQQEKEYIKVSSAFKKTFRGFSYGCF